MTCENGIGHESPIIKDNREEFCEVFGGRARYWDPRFCFDERAVETRDLMINLAKFGENHESLADKLKVSRTLISFAAGGTAGKTLGKDGKSTTDRILSGLRGILNGYQGPDQYNI